MQKRILLLTAVLLLSMFRVHALGEDTVSFGDAAFPRNAEEIDLGFQVVEDWKAFEDFLRMLPNLKKVDMFSTIVEKKDIERLVKSFPNVKFGWTIHITHEHYIRTDQTAFSTLHGGCAPHESRDFEVLKYCTELRALDIGHNDVTDLSFLPPLTKLRVLILACNENLHSIQVLSTLKDLEYLELFSCPIENIRPLAELPHLMDLNIAYTNVYKYSVLFEMPQLKRLWIPQLGIYLGKEEIEKLQAALPDTIIMNHGHPTDNGWREGSHYETIYQIFHSDEYIPFEDSYPIED